MSSRYAVVVPSVGRPSLGVLLSSLAAQEGPLPEEVVVVDDRRDARPGDDLAAGLPPVVRERLEVRAVRGFGRGPAAARNLGWRLARAPWIAFLDDDVELPDGWASALEADLTALPEHAAASQGRIVVPLPTDRRPTDWERSTAGLEDAQWATADMAFRRDALLAVHGFDERFPRAYREDADLALRLREAGWELRRGTRTVVHPVRPEGPRVSVRVQRGNADDALMRRLHGRDWRQRSGAGRGRLPWHLATVGASVTAVAAALVAAGRKGPAASGSRRVATAGAGVALGLWAHFTARRVLPGPRSGEEVARMLWTSAAIPPAAVWHRARGWWRHRHAQAWPPRPLAVLFDRDGTLIHDVPYNGDPTRVQPVHTAAYAVDSLRRNGIRIAVVSNQSGVARGLIDGDQVAAVNQQVERLLGRFDTWQVCAHGPEDGCTCRKPAPGLVLEAARQLGVRPQDCVVIGDIGADATAARAAGASAILVPTDATRPEEIRDAPVVATDLREAVDLLLGGSDG